MSGNVKSCAVFLILLFRFFVWMHGPIVGSIADALTTNVSNLDNSSSVSKNDSVNSGSHVTLNVIHIFPNQTLEEFVNDGQHPDSHNVTSDRQKETDCKDSTCQSKSTSENSSPHTGELKYNFTIITPLHSFLNDSGDHKDVTRYEDIVTSKLDQYFKFLNSCMLNLSKVRRMNLYFLDSIFLDYDKRAWPTLKEEKPTLVRVNININTLGPVNAAQMEYGMDIYLRQMWKDPRLELKKYNVGKDVTLNAEDIASKIWKPDIFFRNVKQANFHKVTVPNKLIKISPDGSILYSMRITMRLSCHMSFKNYPLDSQKCQLLLGAYAQTTEQVVIQWREKDPVYTETPLELPEFNFAGFTYSNFTRVVDTGNFSFLDVTFVLVRQNGYHLIQTYLPTFLIVMISWVSFWLNVDATAARVTLGVTTLLTLTTVAYGVRMQLPPVSYIKAIDWWIGACSVMIFGALLEFTLVNYLSRSKLRSEDFRNSINLFHWNRKLNMDIENEERVKASQQMEKNLKRARNVDRVCRIVFPTTFSIFNFVYWIYYLAIAENY